MPQTQTPAIKVSAGSILKDPTSNTRYPGDVYVLGTIPLVVVSPDPNQTGLNSLDSEGVYDVPKDSSTFTAGDAVYWATTGSPVVGTASTGAATSTASGNNLMGLATADAATGVAYVRVKLTAAKRTTSIAGSVTADDITGSDSSLGIAGLAANAGGAVAIVGGVGALTGGGAVTMIGGAANGNNAAGGSVTIDGGAGHGTGAAGAVTIGTNAASLTLGKMPRLPVTLVNCAGGNIATATALTASLVVVAGQDNAKGVQLPSCVDGAVCVIVNQATDKTLLVYPPLGKQINGAGANNSIVMAVNTIDFFFSEGTNSWRGFTAAIDLA